MRRLALLLTLTVALASPAAAEELAIVLNAANPVPGISLPELRQIYQGRRAHWPGKGGRVRLVLPLDDEPAMQFVANELLRVPSADHVARHYLARVFQQRATDVPPQLSARAALTYVAREPGAIAIVPAEIARSAPGTKALVIAK